VVLAARLSSATDDILCDAATRTACRHVIRFEPASAVTLKGKGRVADVWRPMALQPRDDRHRSAIVGRAAEAQPDRARLDALERDGAGSVVLIEEMRVSARRRSSRPRCNRRDRGGSDLAGAGDSIERDTAYRAWREIVASVLGADLARDPDRVLPPAADHQTIRRVGCRC
jgi:hypothetical protein